MDVLFVAGDFSYRKTEEELIDFLVWIREQHQGKVVMISGNHDRYYWKNTSGFLYLMKKFSVEYLVHSSIELYGLNIWGSPITPPVMEGLSRRFEMDEAQRHAVWQNIPANTDIIMTHCPPFGILDQAEGISLGCRSLRNKVLEIKPMFHFFGHIHSSYGNKEQDGIRFFNGSLTLDVDTGIVNPPVYIEIS